MDVLTSWRQETFGFVNGDFYKQLCGLLCMEKTGYLIALIQLVDHVQPKANDDETKEAKYFIYLHTFTLCQLECIAALHRSLK